MKYLVVTSINGPTLPMKKFSTGANENNYKFVIIGDKKSPDSYELEHVDFYSIDAQKKLPYRYSEICPTGHYARKNIGYLLAFAGGATEILETDDDNAPLDGIWAPRSPKQSVRTCSTDGWVNLYSYFTPKFIWPRGFPLDLVRQSPPPFDKLPETEIICPVHQGLADRNPDVDAIYRLLFDLPIDFDRNEPVAIANNAWCPFNSQNTTWWREAFPLMYLPFYCSFRMTDIWRSFVTQRILFENGLGILFHHSTVYQDRNDHDLMRDFSDEVDGYKRSKELVSALQNLKLGGKRNSMLADLVKCYERLIELGFVDAKEMSLLSAWCDDCEKILD